MNKKLAPGMVLGHRLSGCRVAGFIYTEASFATGTVLPSHAHENGFFRLIICGASTDISQGREFLGDAASMVYHAAGEAHANVWHRAGRSFVIELQDNPNTRLGERSPQVLDHGQTFASGPIVHAALRIFREFRHMDAVSPLALEGLSLELLAVACRSAAPTEGPGPPVWLHRARELLDDCPNQPHALVDVATAAGVHPGHLARAFRQHYHCTVGEYLRRHRVERACRLLCGSMTLAEVALRTGFADQSHFSATFKRHTGMTPAAYRKTTRGR